MDRKKIWQLLEWNVDPTRGLQSSLRCYDPFMRLQLIVISYALTKIKGVGRRYSNLACVSSNKEFFESLVEHIRANLSNRKRPMST